MIDVHVMCVISSIMYVFKHFSICKHYKSNFFFHNGESNVTIPVKLVRVCQLIYIIFFFCAGRNDSFITSCSLDSSGTRWEKCLFWHFPKEKYRFWCWQRWLQQIVHIKSQHFMQVHKEKLQNRIGFMKKVYVLLGE